MVRPSKTAHCLRRQSARCRHLRMEYAAARFYFICKSGRRELRATLHKQVVTTLRSRRHEIDDRDLYAESFDPVTGEQERRCHDTEVNRAPIAAYANRLLAAEALALVYPVWNEGFPAILKGFFDRVLIPGVSSTIGADGAPIPNLQNLRKLAAVCTYGASRTVSFLLGDPPKRVVTRLLRSMPGRAVRCDNLAYYDMDHSTEGRFPRKG